jgi:flagellar motor switch protein FliM
MEERLTQEEIDTLLAALSSGEIKPNALAESRERRTAKVKTYDFSRPEKFSKEHFRTIQMLHENFARLWANPLGAVLRQPVQASILGVEQMTYEEFIMELPSPTILTTFSMPPLEGNGLMELSTNLGFPIFERLLGGRGGPGGQARELTNIEKRVIATILEDGFVMLKEAWGRLVEVEPSLGTVESNPQFVSVAASGDIVLVVSMEIQVSGLAGMFNILYPYVMLEPIVSYLSAQSFIGVKAAHPDEATVEQIKDFVSRVGVPLRVDLGSARVDLEDLLALEAGDLIKLDTRVDEDMKVYVEGRLKFLGVPGKSRGHLAVKISRVIKNEEDIDT